MMLFNQRKILNATLQPAFRARCLRRFHIDDTGHGDLESTDTDREPRTIYIRFSRVPESMVDALHSIRAIERQFGRLRDYRLLRDSEIRSEYQAICWAAFESPKSLLRVPLKGTTLKVLLPPSLGRPEGGPGLKDLTSLLIPADRSEPSSSDSGEASTLPRSFTLNIKRADSPITFRSTMKPPFRSRSMKAATGHGFLEWGGFARLEPLYASSPFTSPAVDPRPMDSKHMRMALNKWSQVLGVADPLFPEMKKPIKDTEIREEDTENDWDPLPDFPRAQDRGQDAREVEMSRGAQESLRESLESLLQRSAVTKSVDPKSRNEET